MNFLPARGFVLSAFSYGESDKIIQVYTAQLGKVKAIVKGARKPKSKLAAALELFTESNFSLHKRPSADLYVLSQAKVSNSHSTLKEDLASITVLQVLADILLQSIHDMEPNKDIYLLLQKTLDAFEEKKAHQELLLIAFGLRFLELSGYPLELETCVECGTALERKKTFLIPHRGGGLCEDCCPTGPARLKVSPAGLEVLKKLRSLPLEKVHVLKLKPTMLRGLLITLLEYLERTIEKKLKTTDYYLKMVPAET